MTALTPSSTYRLQISPSFPLHAAADVCDYVATLGAGAVYCSPLLPSARGSDHGYDVVRFDDVDPARGGKDGWTRLLAGARSRGLAVVVDIVPNHAGVANAAENPAWWDVLKRGRESEYATWFDIDWSSGKLMLPVLGDGADASQFTVVGDAEDAELRYYEHRFPIAPGTGPRAGESAADVHERQHYRLVNFRKADTEQNYRRFFAVTTLAGLRVEDPAVFERTHAEIRRWVEQDRIDGLRVDHPDGLVDPLGYTERLRALAGPNTWLTVEKILEPGEELPRDWPVDGTTGYDALTEVQGLFVDSSAEAAFDSAYRELTGDGRDFASHVVDGKRMVVDTILHAEVARLARLAPEVASAEAAIAELAVRFPVYRSYLPAGREHLDEAVSAARAARPDLDRAIDALLLRLTDPSDELARRFQQLTGAVMAKGVEDTAYYRYSRFLALNEVGGNPAEFGLDLVAFHRAQRRRQQIAPRSMTTLSTHDTKRGEDVRARLAVLSELPGQWRELASQLMQAAPVSDAAFGYLLWQTFAGAGMIPRERMHAYAEKAMREAATETGWIDPDEPFEKSVHQAVDRAYDDPQLHDPLVGFIEQITPYGWSNSLGQKIVQLTMPGIPDVYQGTELWEDSLVDPDNRRPVDYDRRRELLARLDGESAPPDVAPDGAAKLWVVSRTLRLRRRRPEAFGRYIPVEASGPAAGHVVAFDRGGAVTVATRLPVGLQRRGGWGETVLPLPGRVTDELTGRSFNGEVKVADLLERLPVALLTY